MMEVLLEEVGRGAKIVMELAGYAPVTGRIMGRYLTQLADQRILLQRIILKNF